MGGERMKKKIQSTILRYRSPLLVLTALLILSLFNQTLGLKALGISVTSLGNMLMVLPPVYLILGLLDVWVPREAMVKYMGEKSGILGSFLAFIIGSAAAGPLYGAFPLAAVFMKKGVRFFNIMIFILAWSTTKIPMFLYETSALGLSFSLTRLMINIPGIIIIAYTLNRIINKKDKQEMYKRADDLD